MVAGQALAHHGAPHRCVEHLAACVDAARRRSVAGVHTLLVDTSCLAGAVTVRHTHYLHCNKRLEVKDLHIT